MNIKNDLTEADLRRLIRLEIESKLGDIQLKQADIKIEVKSKQNYKSEWGTADFRASVTVDKP